MLTDEEKVRARYHLGYLNLGTPGSLVAGIPMPSQTIFLLDYNLNNILPAAEPLVRDMLGRLDTTDRQIFEAQDRMQASSVENVTLRADESEALERNYVRWAMRLSDLIHVPLYPYSARFQNAGAAGAGNAGMIPVRH